MPFFLGSFIASFLFSTSLFMELSSPSSVHIDNKLQTQKVVSTIQEISPSPSTSSGPAAPIEEPTSSINSGSSRFAQAVNTVVYGPVKPQKSTEQKFLFPTVTIKPSQTSLSTIAKLTVTEIPSTPTPTPTHTMFTATTTNIDQSTPSPTPKGILQYAPTTSPPGTLNADLIFSLVNQHRISIGLTPFEKDSNTCAIAASRAPQVYDEIYVTHSMHTGLHRENYLYFINENIISMDSEQAAVNWWLNDTIHREAIEGNYKYSCVACSGHQCSEIFTSYIPR